MMSVRSPGFLVALIFAAVPVILYLLFRLRRREVKWGASYILQMTLRTSAKESRWRQYVVLAVRTLLIGLLALAFCRPLLEGLRPPGSAFPRGAGGTLTRVILLDNTRSMEARYGSATRWAEARRLTAQLLKGMSGGDSFVIIPLAGDVQPLKFEPPCGDDEVRTKLGEVRVCGEAVGPDLSGALEKACRHFLSAVTDNRQLIVLSDFAAKDYRDAEALKPFAASLKELGVSCYFDVLARPEDFNVAICGADFGTDLLLAGQPYNLYVDVANYGAAPRLGDRLLVLEESKVVREVELELAPNERKPVRVPLMLPAGEHALEIRAGEDCYEYDNTLHVAVMARKLMRVLMVRESEDEQKGFESEGEFLRRALESVSRGEARAIELASRGPVTVTAADFARADVVILVGLKRLDVGPAAPKGASLGSPRPGRTPSVVGEPTIGNSQENRLPAADEGSGPLAGLKSYLRRGGGVIIGLAPEIDVEHYKPALRDLFGAELLSPYVEQLDYERYLFIQTPDVPEPLLREFATKVNADLGKARVYNHFRVSLAGEGEAGAAGVRPGEDGAGTAELRLANGDPLLVRARCGRGTALLWTSTLGGRWNSLVVRQPFLPLMCRMLDMASSGSQPPRNVPQGAPLISAAPASGELFMLAPGKGTAKVATVSVAGEPYVRYEGTAAPGLYTLTDRDGKMLRAFTVKPSCDESDLRPLAPADRKLIGEAFKARFTDSESALRTAMAGSGHRVDVTWLAVLVVMALALFESLLLRIWF